MSMHKISEKEAWMRVRTQIRRAQKHNWGQEGCCGYIEALEYDGLITPNVFQRMMARLEAHRRKTRKRKPVCNHFLWKRNYSDRLAWIERQISSL